MSEEIQCQAWVHHPHSAVDNQCQNAALPTTFSGNKRYCGIHRPDRATRASRSRNPMAEMRRLREVNRDLLAALEAIGRKNARAACAYDVAEGDGTQWLAFLPEIAKDAIAKATHVGGE